jgi:hypothetical protein
VYEPDPNTGEGHVAVHTAPGQLKYMDALASRYQNPQQPLHVGRGEPPVPPALHGNAGGPDPSEWPIDVTPPPQFFVDPTVIV